MSNELSQPMESQFTDIDLLSVDKKQLERRRRSKIRHIVGSTTLALSSTIVAVSEFIGDNTEQSTVIGWSVVSLLAFNKVSDNAEAIRDNSNLLHTVNLRIAAAENPQN